MSKPIRRAAKSNSLSEIHNKRDADYIRRFERLPQWARAEISTQLSRISALEASLEEASGLLKATAVEINPLNPHLGRPRQFLRDDASVRLFRGWPMPRSAAAGSMSFA